jgi:mandelate racemase
MRYLIPAIHDLGEMLKGRRVAPIEFYEAARKSLHFVGYEGMAMIAVAGIDMAAWDALARAAGVPLCVLLGGSVGPVPGLQQQWSLAEFPRRGCERGRRVTRGGRFRGSKTRDFTSARRWNDAMRLMISASLGSRSLSSTTTSRVTRD